MNSRILPSSLKKNAVYYLLNRVAPKRTEGGAGETYYFEKWKRNSAPNDSEENSTMWRIGEWEAP